MNRSRAAVAGQERGCFDWSRLGRKPKMSSRRNSWTGWRATGEGSRSRTD